jgi:hypothetical protein
MTRAAPGPAGRGRPHRAAGNSGYFGMLA